MEFKCGGLDTFMDDSLRVLTVPNPTELRKAEHSFERVIGVW